MYKPVKIVGAALSISLLAMSAAAAKTTSAPKKQKITAASSTNKDISDGIKTFCSIHAKLKEIEVLGLSFVPGAANIPAIVSAICSVLNTELASNSKSLSAPPRNLPVSMAVSVPVVNPSTGKMETAKVRVRGVFNPVP